MSRAVGMVAILLSATSFAETIEKDVSIDYSLREILDRADRNHPNIMSARAKLMQTRAKLDEAHFAPFSQFKMTGGMGLAPTVRGSNVFSPNTDVSLTSSLGVAWRAGIDGVVPLWTFGKVTHLWEAAEASVQVSEQEVEKQRDAVRMDVRKAYFGLQLARDAQELLKEARNDIAKALKDLQLQVDREEGDPMELLKLQTYSAELDVKEAEAQKYVEIAQTGLRFYAAIQEQEIHVPPIRPPKHRLGHVTRYLEAAKLFRPEIAMAHAGIEARQAQLRLERAQLFPDFGLGLSAGFSTAPEVADQINPFVNDGGNYFHYGAALVFQWKLDFLPESARIRYAEAQLEEVRAMQRFALGGVGAEVEVAYAEVQDWTRRYEAYAKAVKYAKRWLVMTQEAIDVGTMEDRDLLEPAKAYMTNKYNLINATMELNLAMSKLAMVTGWDSVAPDGM